MAKLTSQTFKLYNKPILCDTKYRLDNSTQVYFLMTTLEYLYTFCTSRGHRMWDRVYIKLRRQIHFDLTHQVNLLHLNHIISIRNSTQIDFWGILHLCFIYQELLYSLLKLPRSFLRHGNITLDHRIFQVFLTFHHLIFKPPQIKLLLQIFFLISKKMFPDGNMQ